MNRSSNQYESFICHDFRGKDMFTYYEGFPTRYEFEETADPFNNYYQGNIYIYGDEPIPPWFHTGAGSVDWIAFNSAFNQPVSNLPRNVSRVEFGMNFNKKLRCLSKFDYIKYLEVGESFNKKLDHLPDCVEELVIRNADYRYNLNRLPKNLKKLVVHTVFEKNIILPEGCILKRKVW
jgi:hypothetical protein